MQQPGASRLITPAPLAAEAAREERALAVARIVVAAASLLLASLEIGFFVRFTSLVQGYLLLALGEGLLVLLLLRKRDPTPAFRLLTHGADLGLAVAVALSSGAPGRLLLAFVLLAAAYRWGLGATMATAGIAAILILVAEAFFPSGPRLLSALVSVAYLLLLGFVTGYLMEKEKQFRAETSQATAMDRALVARELHDGAIQSLIGVEVQVDVLRRQVPEASPLAEELARIQDLLRQEVVSLRELMQQMRPLDIGSERLLDFLAESVARFRRETGIAASFATDLHEVLLPPRVCQELARITQEGLVNVRKHSGAGNVVVRFGREGDSFQLVIDDDGHGFDFEGRLGQAELDAARKGPVIIKERVRSIGGELTVESTKGRGARLTIVLPEKNG